MIYDYIDVNDCIDHHWILLVLCYVILICFITAPAGFLTTPCLLWFRFCCRLHLHFSPSLQHANPTRILDPDPLKRIELLQEKLVVYFSSSNHGKVETGYGTSKMMLPLHSLLGPLFTELLLWVEWYFAFSDILVSSCRARVFNMIAEKCNATWIYIYVYCILYI